MVWSDHTSFYIFQYNRNQLYEASLLIVWFTVKYFLRGQWYQCLYEFICFPLYQCLCKFISFLLVSMLVSVYFCRYLYLCVLNCFCWYQCMWIDRKYYVHWHFISGKFDILHLKVDSKFDVHGELGKLN